ncbi:MAG: TetR/AcrR family transcriptional regulator [Actinomycetota bacterium]
MAGPRGQTRERILDAALTLFLERGIAGTTVSDIERAVGLAAGTGSFYRHFPSKEAIVVPAFERGLAQAAEAIAEERARPVDAEDSHERAVADLQDRLADMHRIQPLWTLLMLERAQYPELERVFARALWMGAWDVDLADDPARPITLAALAGFHMLSLLDGSPYRDVDPGEFIAALVALTMPGVDLHS